MIDGTPNNRTKVLVTGAYGETGRRVVAALAKSSSIEVVAAGRSLEKLHQLVKESADPIGAQVLDIDDGEGLVSAIRATDIVVNCVGPMQSVEDKVAGVAINEGRHYVDPGGSQKLYKRLAPRHREAVDKRLHVVVCAGWIAGVSEVLPYFLLESAQARFTKIRQFHAICGDTNLWSQTATQDFINFVQSGESAQRIGRQVRGKWKSEGLFSMWHRFVLPEPIGRITAFSRYQEEFSCLAGNLEIPVISSNVALTSFSTLRTIRRIRTDKSIDVERARRMLNGARTSDQSKYPVKSFVAGQLIGDERGGSKGVVVSAAIVGNDHYCATAASAAVTTTHVAQRVLKAKGVSYLSQTANPSLFINDLAALNLRVVGL